MERWNESRWPRLPPPVTMITCSIPLAIASSTPYWMVGLSTSGSISFGWALVTGRKRVPRPAAGKIALRTVMFDNLTSVDRYPSQTWVGAPPRASRRRASDHDARRWQRRLRDARDDRPHGGCESQGGRGAAGRGSDDSRLRGPRPPSGARAAWQHGGGHQPPAGGPRQQACVRGRVPARRSGHRLVHHKESHRPRQFLTWLTTWIASRPGWRAP